MAAEIYVCFSPNAFQFLVQSALGVTRVTHENCVQKSIGVSKTFKPISEYGDYEEIVKCMSGEVAERMREQKIMGKTITLEIKTVKFNVR